MHKSPVHFAPDQRRLTGVFALAAVVALLAGLMAGCSSTPRAALNVPGNYVANLWTPTVEYPGGSPTATVLMCLDEASAVFLETGDGSWGAVGFIELTWGGVEYRSSGDGDPTTLTTPVLQPGCGQLTFGVDCCHIDNYLAIKASKV